MNSTLPALLARTALLLGALAGCTSCVSIQSEASLPAAWRAALRPRTGAPPNLSGRYVEQGSHTEAHPLAFLSGLLLTHEQRRGITFDAWELRQPDSRRLVATGIAGGIGARSVEFAIEVDPASGAVSLPSRTEGGGPAAEHSISGNTVTVTLYQGRDGALYSRTRTVGAALVGPMPVIGGRQRWARFPRAQTATAPLAAP